MVRTSALYAAAAFAIGAVAAPPLFASELDQLTSSIINTVDSAVSGLLGGGSPNPPRRRCKVYPGDREWPSDRAWNALNRVVDNRLLKPSPQAAVCYDGPLKNENECAFLTANWQNNSYIHLDDPIEMLSPIFQGRTCMPQGVFDSGDCTSGGFPMYVINATTPKHVQAGVNFARNTGVRLVVKNTGHDFLGKSGGRNALSIWTHHFKDIEYIENYEDGRGYTGAAFKAGTGVQAFEIYKAASEKGVVVVGGEGQTVGVMGGYLQGGGHSPLSSIAGAGADQVLAFEVVTPDGKFVTADAKQNTDLFYAMRGGGGGTYGVATSVTVKAYPDTTTSFTTFTFDSSNITAETFWAGIKAYFDVMESHADAGLYAYSLILPNVPAPGSYQFIMWNLFGFGKSQAQLTELQNPLITALTDLGITVVPSTKEYASFYPAWVEGFPLETVGKPSSIYGNRLFPRANFADDGLRQKTLEAVRTNVEKGYVQVFFNMKVVAEGSDAAVNPAWRENILMAINSIDWPKDASDEVIKATYDQMSYVDNKLYRDISPGAGSYLAEADRREPDWQQSFYGSNYPRLLEIKKKRDPRDVFWAATAVGSEGWKVETTDFDWTENGRLCRV